MGTQTVVALISDLAGNVGVVTNRHVLTAYTTGTYSSDAAGCVTQIVYQGPLCQQSKVLSWDVEYRLTSVKTNGATAESYTLDPLGRRISTTASDGTITRYLNDGQHVLADLDSTGGVLRTYLYGPNTDELLAMTACTGATPRTYFAIRDHQNTIWAWTDTNDVVVESYDFDAWGRVLSVADGNGDTLVSSAIGNRYLFQGREYSWTTGLYYFRARWYDPVTGRWLSPDPIGISGGFNQYVFCGNDSANYCDAFGFNRYITRWAPFNSSDSTILDRMHCNVGVDTWERDANGQWQRTGQVTFDFSYDWDRGPWNFLGVIANGYGRVSESRGLHVGSNCGEYSSTPEQDIAMLRALRGQVANPPFYNVLFHQCVFWSVGAVQIGMDQVSGSSPSGHRLPPAVPQSNPPALSIIIW